MRLTDDELTRLHALERRLVAEDPPLARAFGNLQTPATGKLLQQLIAVGAVLSWGLGMLIFGLVTDVMPLVVVGMLATTLFPVLTWQPVLTWRPYNWLGDSK